MLVQKQYFYHHLIRPYHTRLDWYTIILIFILKSLINFSLRYLIINSRGIQEMNVQNHIHMLMKAHQLNLKNKREQDAKYIRQFFSIKPQKQDAVGMLNQHMNIIPTRRIQKLGNIQVPMIMVSLLQRMVKMLLQYRAE